MRYNGTSTLMFDIYTLTKYGNYKKELETDNGKQAHEKYTSLKNRGKKAKVVIHELRFNNATGDCHWQVIRDDISA